MPSPNRSWSRLPPAGGRTVVQARSFAEILEQTSQRYQNRTVEAAQVIEELIQIARELREASARGEKLGLSEDELAFYDALETNDSAVPVLGDETLRDIVREPVEIVRRNVTIDWTLRENMRGQSAPVGPSHPSQARLPARQAGEGRGRCWSRRRRCRPGGQPQGNLPWTTAMPSSSRAIIRSNTYPFAPTNAWYEAGIAPPAGRASVSRMTALVEPIVGVHKAKVTRMCDPWRGLDSDEFVTLKAVD